MSLLEPPADPSDPARLVAEAGRVCDRLRSMPLTRLSARDADGRRRAQSAFEVAQRLADAAADLSGRRRQVLPLLADPAAGDVVAVCAIDLVEALEAPAVRGAAAEDACRAAVADLRSLRRQL